MILFDAFCNLLLALFWVLMAIIMRQKGRGLYSHLSGGFRSLEDRERRRASRERVEDGPHPQSSPHTRRISNVKAGDARCGAPGLSFAYL